MISLKKVAVCLALFAVVGLATAPAFAGLLGTGLSYPKSPSGSWEGTGTFYNATSGLQGNIEWAVFTAANFSTLFPSDPNYSPTGNELVYAYQVFNTGAVNISLEAVALLSGAPADNDGYFTAGTPPMTGQAPFDSSITSTQVIWDFKDYRPAGSNYNIVPGDHSTGLAFCSIRAPRSDFSITVDGGTSASALVGGPGNVSIPEPSTLILLAVAAAMFGFIRSRR
jgi:hypothetical protein